MFENCCDSQNLNVQVFEDVPVECQFCLHGLCLNPCIRPGVALLRLSAVTSRVYRCAIGQSEPWEASGQGRHPPPCFLKTAQDRRSSRRPVPASSSAPLDIARWRSSRSARREQNEVQNITSDPSTVQTPRKKTMTEAALEANRRNATKFTCPRTPAGKLKMHPTP